MPFRPAPSPAPSARPYALLEDTFTTADGRAQVQAYWLGRKDGRTTISYGTVRMWWQVLGAPHPFENPTWQECLDHADSRHGGTCLARWDGQRMWAAADVDEEERARLREDLDAVLRALPGLPPGASTWMRLHER